MYHLIYPIFFKNKVDHELFFLLSKKKLGWQTGILLNSEYDFKTIVFTDNQFIRNEAIKQGLTVHFCDKLNIEHEKKLPFGSTYALNYILCNKNLLNSDGIALIDFRSPDVTTDEIKGILKKLEKQPGIWIAFFEPEDHPAQYNLYFETVAIELHMARDIEDHPNTPCLSKAYSIYIPRNIKVEGTFYLRMPLDGLCPDFELITKEQALQEVEGKSIIMQCSPMGMGKRMISRNAPWPKSAFIPFGGYLDESKVLIHYSDNHNEIKIFIQPLPPDIYKFSVFAANNGVISTHPVWESWIPISKAMQSFKFKDKEYLGPISTFPCHSCDGVFVVIERQIQKGCANTKYPLIMKNGGWTVENDEDTIINTQTNRRISGRQDFPDVLEFDSSLIATTVGKLAQIQNPDFVDGAYGYRMPKRSSISRALKLGFTIPPQTP